MSVFDYPRINFTGTITLNPGTANNDDYSGGYETVNTHKNLALFDSANVQPRTLGLSDDEFLEWIQKQQTFSESVDPDKQQSLIPAEWNYYGNMSSSISASVVGVQTSLDTIYSKPVTTEPLSGLVGTPIMMSGNITDVNSEGSPPATQFFLSGLNLTAPGIEVSGTLSKAACQWIYFTRNVNMQGDEGAGGYMYHVAKGAKVTLPGVDSNDIVGVVLRYYIYAKHDYQKDPGAIVDLYKNKLTNSAEFQITGTISPLMKDETIFTTPVGRLMIEETPNIPTPCGANNNASGDKLALAPAVAYTDASRISIDFLGSFPEEFVSDPKVSWSNPSKKNPKYNFGAVSLQYKSAAGETFKVGDVDYCDTDGGNTRGWVFDYDISGSDKQGLRAALQAGGGSFELLHPEHGIVLGETEYFPVSNIIAGYAEQNLPGDSFVNQGYPPEPATLELYRHGEKLSATDAPPIEVWGYRSTPLGFSGKREVIVENLAPGQPITIPTDQPGNILMTFEIAGQSNPGATGKPPETYAEYIAPPFMTLANRSSISIRTLPNADYSDYWETDDNDELVAKDNLSFEFLYQEVLRNYYLLFPAMKKVFDLSNSVEVASHGSRIIELTGKSAWHQFNYMPITRDLSESRRNLLQAWCRKHNTQ